MSVETVNNHVLFTEPPNWETPVKWERRWRNEVAASLQGGEARMALRSLPRLTLSWRITPWSSVRRNLLEDAIRAARKTGLGCAPYWGRASVLQSACTAAAVALADGHWAWQAGDPIFFQRIHSPSNIEFEVRTVEDVDGSTLTLDQAVAFTSPAGAFVWPLVFGKFSCPELTAETNWRGGVDLTLSEMTPGRAAQLGSVTPPGGTGIGAMTIGGDFVIAEDPS